MGRIYAVAVSGVSKNSPQDIISIFAGSLALRIREFGIISYNATNDENIDFAFARFSSGYTAGSGGSSRTPEPLVSTEPSASFTAHANDTTQATGTQVQLLGYGVDLDKGVIYSPDEALCPIVQPTQAFVISSGSSSSVDFSCYVLVEELS